SKLLVLNSKPILKFKFKSTSLNLNYKPFFIVDNFIHNTAKTPLFLNPISPYYLLQAIANHQKTVFF
ncbi:hypothetical protein, partial [Acinetobacter pittii]